MGSSSLPYRLIAVLLVAVFFLALFFNFSHTTEKEEPTMPGGISDSNTDDPEIQEVARKAMVQINAKTNDDFLYKLVKVTNARTQVVAGLQYYLTILAAPTTCKKNSGITDAENCTIDTSKTEKQFKIQVYSAPWQDIFEVTMDHSSDKR